MKTKLEAIQRIASVIAIAIITLAIIGCKQDESAEVQPATTKTLSFGTNCKVTITSTDTFTTDEWNTLCDNVVAAIERGYNSAGVMAKGGIETYFTDNTVSVVLLKSATYDVEVKSDVSNTIYLKANASAIDGISGADILSAISAAISDGSYPTP